MKRYNIEVSGKRSSVDLPTTWTELTLGQMMQIEKMKEPDPVQLFSILSGVDVAEASGDMEDDLFQATAFVFSPPDWDKIERPEYIILDGVPYKVPQIENETIGQAVMVSTLVGTIEDLSDAIIPILAIYFQPLVDKTKFDRMRLPAIEKMIKRTAAVEGFATASFFLRASRTLRRIIKTESPLLKSAKMQLLLETPTKSSGALSGSTIS